MDIQALAVSDEKIGNITSQPIHLVESGPTDKNGFPIFDTNECFAKYQRHCSKSEYMNNDDDDKVDELVEQEIKVEYVYTNFGLRLYDESLFDETDRGIMKTNNINRYNMYDIVNDDIYIGLIFL